jgi:cysteine desulfurase/selenocysteine lyase
MKLVEIPTMDEVQVERWRADFPILESEIHGKPLIYLDNAATTQKPQAVIDAEARYYREDNANVHRGVHALSQRATDAFEAARTKVQRFINAARSDEIVFVRGTTEAINLVAQSYARPHLREGDEIIISALEHHSNIVPWQMVCQQTGAVLRVIPVSDAGELDIDAYENLLGERTKLVALAHVSNALGTINPVRAMIAKAHTHGVPVLLDGAQAIAHLPVDVQALGCDFYAFSGHKIYAPMGIGVLYGKALLLEEMPPYQGGGDMIRTVAFEHTEYNILPYKFEAGTPNVAGAIGLGAALDYLSEIGMETIAAYEAGVLDYATRAIEDIPGMRLIGTAQDKTAILSFLLEGVHAHDIGTILDRQGIAIRAGHHCAMPLMKRFGVAATARASFALYNTQEEADALAAGLQRTVELFKR